MIGEIRDRETAKTAVEAALTGHLVFTTVHSKDPVGCMYRMMDFGISAEELRQTIVCISAQRLIRSKSGKMGAVFEIIQEEKLGKVADAIIEGERVVIAIEERVETLDQEISNGKCDER